MKPYRQHLSNILSCAAFGAVCGALTGGTVFLFKWAATRVEALSGAVYAWGKDAPAGVLVLLALLAVAALGMALLHKFVPEVVGGGIPRSEGVLRGVLRFRPLRTLLGTIVGSMISFACGLPLGSEGPSVLIGTSLGSLCTSHSKNRMAWERYVMTGGAGAGFAVATGAPLAGILFALEEIHKRFTPMLVLTVSVSVLSATYVNRLLCNAFSLSPELFEIEPLAIFDLRQVVYLLLLGVAIALAVGGFDLFAALFARLTERWKHQSVHGIKLVAVFLLTGVLALYLPSAVYSGHATVHDVIQGHTGVLLLIALWLVRFFMMQFMIDSGATGGIFIPTLAIGALSGAIVAELLLLLGMPQELYVVAVLLGMCAFMGGVLRAPLTATVLFVELTGQYTNLFYVALVVFTVHLFTELFHQLPLYDRALESMEHRQNAGREPTIAHFEVKISKRAFVVGKAVRDIMWPPSTVVISITRENEHQADMDNDGEKKLCAGDTIVLRSRFYDENEVRGLIAGLVGAEHEIFRKE